MTTPKSNTVECYICKQQKNPNDCWANRARGKLQNYNCVKPCGQPPEPQPQPKTPPLNKCTCPKPGSKYSWLNKLLGIGKAVEEQCLHCKPQPPAPPKLEIGSGVQLKTIRVTSKTIRNIVEELDEYETEEDKPLIKQLGGLRKRSSAR